MSRTGRLQVLNDGCQGIRPSIERRFIFRLFRNPGSVIAFGHGVSSNGWANTYFLITLRSGSAIPGGKSANPSVSLELVVLRLSISFEFTRTVDGAPRSVHNESIQTPVHPSLDCLFEDGITNQFFKTPGNSLDRLPSRGLSQPNRAQFRLRHLRRSAPVHLKPFVRSDAMHARPVPYRKRTAGVSSSSRAADGVKQATGTLPRMDHYADVVLAREGQCCRMVLPDRQSHMNYAPSG